MRNEIRFQFRCLSSYKYENINNKISQNILYVQVRIQSNFLVEQIRQPLLKTLIILIYTSYILKKSNIQYKLLKNNNPQMSGQLVPIKLVVIGDGYVGKTSILMSYIKEEFKQGYQPTVFDNHSVVVKVENNMVSLGLWDTAGQEEYASLRPLAYNNCDVFLIIFSVIDQSSYHNAKVKWFNQLEKCAPTTTKIFVGNKTDLRNPTSPQHITYQKAYKQITQQLHVTYLECSALTRNGLDEVFVNAMKSALLKKNLIKVKSCCNIF